MKYIYQIMLDAAADKKRMLAVLIDPEKTKDELLTFFMQKVNASIATHILIGGSTDKNNHTESIVKKIKSLTSLPLLLFPGDYKQLTAKADALLFLSLLSGRNPEYLIGQHLKAIPRLKNLDLQIIPTGYILIDGGVKTTVQTISETQPIAQNNIELIEHTALAGQYAGKKLIYLEAGSGALHPVNPEIIRVVKQAINIPLIVGGGIRNKEQLNLAYEAGADMVVIGNALEQDVTFFNDLLR